MQDGVECQTLLLAGVKCRDSSISILQAFNHARRWCNKAAGAQYLAMKIGHSMLDRYFFQ
jgi:hypothetical protein